MKVATIILICNNLISTLCIEEVRQLSCAQVQPTLSLYSQPFTMAPRKGSPWSWLTLGDPMALMKKITNPMCHPYSLNSTCSYALCFW